MGQVKSHISDYFNNQSNNTDCEARDKVPNNKDDTWYTKRTYIDIQDTKKRAANESSFAFGIIATPRNPLKRSRQISPSSVLPQSILDIFSPSKKIRIEEKYLDFHFLDDENTVEYNRKSKIMVILRGLPGSGKSTIAKHIQRKYLSCKICSADDFFMKDGEYAYDRSLIKEAHAQCQEKAIKAVQDQISVVIIDNTNLKLWEMNFYLDVAKKFNYVPVIVEPKTPWRTDVSALVSKTLHNIDEQIMEFKKADYEELLPIYYGWFLNEKDSYLFIDESRMWLETAYQIPEFMNDVRFHTKTTNLQELLNYYSVPEQMILHCTAQYVGKYLSPENRTYVENAERFIGKAFDIEVVGFVLTPRTFGARIKLCDEHLIVWGKDDDEAIPQEFLDVADANDIFFAEEENGVNEEESMNFDTVDGVNGDENNVNEVFESFNNVSAVEEDANEPLKVLHSTTNGDQVGSDDASSQNSDDNLPTATQLNGNRDTSIVNISTNSKEETSPKKIAETSHVNGSSPFKRSPKKSPKKQKSGVLIPENTITIEKSVTKETVSLHPWDTSEVKRFIPTRGKGSRAHFTLGCAPDVKPVTTGLDMILAIKKEAECHKISNNDTEPLSKSLKQGLRCDGTLDADLKADIRHEIVVEGATLRNYNNGVWVIYLEERIKVKSIFAACF